MRLSETRFIIESNLPALDAVKCSDDPGNSSLSIMINIPDAIFAIDNLKVIQCLTPSITRLTSNEIYSMPMKNFKINKSRANDFMNSLAKIKEQCGLIVKLANDTVPKMDKDIICIKLADDSTFDSMSETVKAFSNLFNLISANQRIDGEIKLSGIESGSMWIYAAATKAATKLLNSIIDDIYGIVNKYIEIKKNNEIYKQLEIKTDIMEKEKEVHNKMCEHLIHEIDKANNLNLPQDEMQQWIKNISNIAILIEKGTEVHPSLAASSCEKSSRDNEIKKLENMTTEINLLSSSSKESSADNISNDTPTDDNSAEE